MTRDKSKGSDPHRDMTETADPSKRRYYTRSEWIGQIYADGDGYERCASQWHFPCCCCHRKANSAEIKANEQEADMEYSQVSPMSIPLGTKASRLGEVEQAMLELRALQAHEEEVGEAVAEQQFVYVYNQD